MKLQMKFFWSAFGILLLAGVSCGPFQTPMVPVTPFISAEATTPFASTQAIPSQTPTALVIPSATIATVAIVPTVDLDQAYSFLQRVMEGSSDCQLPCWGGIKPGVTSNAEAEKLLQPLSILIHGGAYHPYKGKLLSGPGGGRDFFFGDIEISFDFGWALERDEDIVEIILFSADAFDQNSEWIYGTEPYNQLFEKYNLNNILSKYGIPSEIWTIATVYNYGPNRETFRLQLLYDKGIFIKYTMPLRRIGENLGEACPSEAFINMMLVPSGTSQFYQEMQFSSVAASFYQPIEKATQMTFDEFYQTFMKSNTPCFEIPLNIWPEH